MKFVGTESSGRALAPEIMSVLLGDKCCHWHWGGGKQSVASPPLIGCISIIISARPPPAPNLDLSPAMWLACVGIPVQFASHPQDVLFPPSLSHLASSVFILYIVCVSVLTRLQQHTSTKGTEQWKTWLKQRVIRVWRCQLQLMVWSVSCIEKKKALWQEMKPNDSLGYFNMIAAI